MPCEIFTNSFARYFVLANDFLHDVPGAGCVAASKFRVKGWAYHTFTIQILCSCHCCRQTTCPTHVSYSLTMSCLLFFRLKRASYFMVSTAQSSFQ